MKKICDLYEEMDKFFIYKSLYYLFIPPFKNKKLIKDNKLTLKKLNLFPNSNLTLIFYDDRLNKKKSKIFNGIIKFI